MRAHTLMSIIILRKISHFDEISCPAAFQSNNNTASPQKPLEAHPYTASERAPYNEETNAKFHRFLLPKRTRRNSHNQLRNLSLLAQQKIASSPR